MLPRTYTTLPLSPPPLPAPTFLSDSDWILRASGGAPDRVTMPDAVPELHDDRLQVRQRLLARQGHQ
jgi:hypothetical protein